VNLTYLTNLWDENAVSAMDEPERLVYRSNLLGSDKRLTNYGGGNTSAKIPMSDPVTGETATVLWVKGSGGDLGTIKRDGFATLYQDKLDALKRRYRGVAFEDEMVDLYPLCTFGNNPRAASIDTPLHAFLPFPHVDHLHPDWAISLAASANGKELLAKLYEETGIDLIWLPWKRPGFELGLWLENAIKANPKADGILLGSHGLFTWGETGRACYENTLRVLDAVGRFVLPRVEAVGDGLFGGAKYATPRADRRELAARLLPALRGQVNGGAILGHFDDGPEVLRFVGSRQAEELAYQGTSCPDHFVRTKVRPLLVDWNPETGDFDGLLAAARAAFPAYREDYARYYDENKLPDSPALRAPEPTVVLVPGVGLFSFGKSKTEARITAEFYVNAIHVMEGATALGAATGNRQPATGEEGLPPQFQPTPYLSSPATNHQSPVTISVVSNYVALPPREAFNIEYWSLEEAKLRRLPAEKELSRKVAVVVGAGPGIGLSTALRLAKEGAHVVCADLKAELAESCAAEVRKVYGAESAVGLTVDASSRESVRALLDGVALAYGGLDIVAMVVGLFIPPDEKTGRVTDDQWRKTFDINVLAAYVVADEAKERMAAQVRADGSAAGGSIVLFTSANAVVAKKGSFAYDTAKAALAHLVREMAVECAPHGVRVNAIAPASVVEGSQMFPRERVITSLAKYDIAFDESETTEALREKLTQFYARRTLLKKPVTPAYIAEAALLLAGPRLPLTTGQTIPVDAGLTEAFLR
jgi:rhamnose utilization protein RhaD (predicted bifunctional aldolase and dehydrogenase)/NAD(P)-dependent dehydrogenase (short-subunit alcohol dehydrogenase family)